MKLSQWIGLNGLLFLALGIAFGLYGPPLLGFFGIFESGNLEGLGYWYVAAFARIFGAALFGYGLLLMAMRSLAADPAFSASARRGVLFALVLANIFGIFVSVTQQLSIWGGWAGWVFVGIFILFLLVYAYFLVAANKEEAQTGDHSLQTR